MPQWEVWKHSKQIYHVHVKMTSSLISLTLSKNINKIIVSNMELCLFLIQ